MYSNNIVNFQESLTILNACTKKVWKLIEFTTYHSLFLSVFINITLFLILFELTLYHLLFFLSTWQLKESQFISM